MTSSRPPVGNTCPDIDRCQRWLKEASERVDIIANLVSEIEHDLDVVRDDVPITLDLLYAITRELHEIKGLVDFSGTLEELRDANSALRDWGYALSEELEKAYSEK